MSQIKKLWLPSAGPEHSPLLQAAVWEDCTGGGKGLWSSMSAAAYERPCGHCQSPVKKLVLESSMQEPSMQKPPALGRAGSQGRWREQGCEKGALRPPTQAGKATGSAREPKEQRVKKQPGSLEYCTCPLGSVYRPSRGNLDKEALFEAGSRDADKEALNAGALSSQRN
jgi:hypothetical protein